MTTGRALELLVAAALMVGVGTAEAVAARPPEVRTVGHRDAARHEAAFVADINRLRAGLGLPALRVRPNLTRKARGWAATMAAARAIWHSRLSNGVTGHWHKLGENVGRGVSQPDIHAAFVASGSHYRNLVDPNFRYVGVGVVIVERVIFVSEVFMQPGRPTPARRTSAMRLRPARPRTLPPAEPVRFRPFERAVDRAARARAPGLLFRPVL